MADSVTNPLQPTYIGIVKTEQDAMLLFDACSKGALNLASRGPSHDETPELIRSGCVFIYDKNTPSIQSWTDSTHWAPVSIECSFRVERESDNIHGLFKKTITKGDHHMISFYTAADSAGGSLMSPSKDSELRFAMLRAELNSNLLVTHSSHDFTHVAGSQHVVPFAFIKASLPAKCPLPLY